MVKCHFDSYKLSQARGNIPISNAIRAVVTKWRFNVGSGKELDPEGNQLNIESTYLIENYPELTVHELDWCVSLFTTRKLNLDYRRYPNYPNFTMMFMSEIVDGFLEYKKFLVKSLDDKMKNQITAGKPTHEQKLELAKKNKQSMCFMISEVHTLLGSNRDYIYLLDTVYRYLRRTKKLLINQQLIDEAKKFAKGKYLRIHSDDNLMAEFIRSSMTKTNRENLQQMFSREHCVRWYFKNHSLEDVIKSVQEKEFYEEETPSNITPEKRSGEDNKGV